MHNMPHTEEVKLKISKSKKGKKIKSYVKSKEHIEKIRQTLKKGYYTNCLTCGKKLYSRPSRPRKYCNQQCTGKSKLKENNPNWNEGKSFQYKFKHYRNKEYLNWRKQVFERDEYTCLMCYRSNCFLVPHHILSYTDYPNFRYDIDNGMTLCEECHKIVHSKKETKVQEIYYERNNK